MIRALTITALIPLCALLAASASAHPAWGIVVDRNNQIYFSDLETIWKIDAQGKLAVFRPGVSGTHVHELNLDEAGNLYGAENSYEPSNQRFFSAVWKMTPAGVFSYLLAATDNPPAGTSIWKDRDGNMYHVTNFPERELLVLKRTPSGNVTALVGSSKALREYHQGVPYSIGGIALGSEGALFFTDGPNLRRITPDGKLTVLVHDLAVQRPAESPLRDSPVTRLFGITVDPQGNAFVADYGNRRVLKITSAGAESTVASSEQPWSPTGVAFKDGDLYILEFGFKPPGTYTPRVRKVSADGRVTLVATVGADGRALAGGSTAGASPESITSVSPATGSTAGGSPVSAEPSPKLSAGPQTRTYVLLGLGLGILALTTIIWQVRRKISARHSSAIK